MKLMKRSHSKSIDNGTPNSKGLEAPSDIVVRGGITEMEKRLCC